MSNTQGASAQPQNYAQFIRKIGLVVFAPQGSPLGQGGIGSDAVAGQSAGPAGSAPLGSNNGLDLSQMHIKFHVEGMSFDRPKSAVIRVYNLAASTQATIKNEFQAVMLQAGYENGAYGVIFQGTIKRIRTGRESAVDTFLEIMAADGDLAFNNSYVNKALAAGSTLLDKAQAGADAMQKSGGITSSNMQALQAFGGIVPAPRGQVLFGLASELLNDVASSTNTSWFIENGVLTFVSNTGYLPGTAVVLNSQTGMVGIPEATNNGIEVAALLNPNIKIGTQVQIDNASINQTQINSQGFPSYTDITFVANTTNDGFYKVLVVTHLGDSRGNEWYTKMACFALDASAAPGSSVLAYG
jgi:hypothetical protein